MPLRIDLVDFASANVGNNVVRIGPGFTVNVFFCLLLQDIQWVDSTVLS